MKIEMAAAGLRLAASKRMQHIETINNSDLMNFEHLMVKKCANFLEFIREPLSYKLLHPDCN